MPGALRAALSLLAAAVVLAGCGGDAEERNAYVDEVNRAQQSFAQASNRVTTELGRSSSIGSYREGLEELVAALDETTAQLRDVEPPDAVSTQHEELVNALDSYGNRLGDVAEALDDDAGSKELLQARRDLLEVSDEVEVDINRTIGEINGRLGE